MRLLGFSLLAAFVLVQLLLYLAKLNQTAALLILPFYVIGTFVTKNPHAPADWAVHASLFTFLFIACYALTVLLNRVKKTQKDNRP
jgi:O-antigen ligase